MPGRRRRRVCRNLSLPLLTGLSRRFSAPRLRRKQRGAESHSQSHSQRSLEGKVLSLLAAGQPMSRLEFSRKLGQKKISGQLNKIIRLLMRERSIEYTPPDKPQSRFQKYRLTDKDRAAASRPWARGMSGDEPWRRTENSDAAAPGRIDNQVLRDMLFH